MARLSFDIPDDLLKKLDDCGKMETIAPKMIDAALPIAAEAVRKHVAPHTRSGELARSIGVMRAKPTKGKSGHSGKVWFSGKDKETGTSNAVKAMALEYGTSKQTATPFVTPAMNECEPACVYKMQEVYNAEVAK